MGPSPVTALQRAWQSEASPRMSLSSVGSVFPSSLPYSSQNLPQAVLSGWLGGERLFPSCAGESNGNMLAWFFFSFPSCSFRLRSFSHLLAASSDPPLAVASLFPSSPLVILCWPEPLVINAPLLSNGSSYGSSSLVHLYFCTEMSSFGDCFLPTLAVPGHSLHDRH